MGLGATVMMSTRNADALRQAAMDALAKRMDDVGKMLVEAIKQALDEPYPPASDPGEYPHKRTGQLQASVSHEVSTLEDGSPVLYVGVSFDDARYAGYLELGTSQMAPRPFLQLTLDSSMDTIRQMLGDSIQADIIVAMGKQGNMHNVVIRYGDTSV